MVVADVDGRAAAVEHDQLVAVGLLQHGGAQHLGGRAERDLAAVQAQHALEAARLLDVVGGDEQRAALVAQLAQHRLDARGARRVDARERLVEQQHARVLDERAGDQHALALAAGERAEARAGARRRARRARAPASAVVALRAAEPAVEGRAVVGAHQRDVERVDGEVQPGVVGLGHVGRRARPARPRRGGRAARRAARGTASSCRRRWARARPPTVPGSSANETASSASRPAA